MRSADRLRLHPLAPVLETMVGGGGSERGRGCKVVACGRGKACGFDLMRIVGNKD